MGNTVEVEVNAGEWVRGERLYLTSDGMVAVKLDGERGIFYWHAERVRAVA